MIEFHNYYNNDVPHFDEEHFSLWLSQIVEVHNKVVGELNYYFYSDDELLKINMELLDHDFYTDIITEDASIDNLIFGEAYLSIDRIIDNARSNNVSVELEFARVVAHGCLHLLGYNDKTEKEALVMREKENWALSLLS